MKNTTVKLISVIILISLFAVAIPFLFSMSKPVKEAFNDASFVTSSDREVNAENTEGKTLAVWIATVYNLNYHTSKNMTEDEIREEAEIIVENISNLGLNTVYLQVRPTADAIYPSEFFPWSEWITGKQGLDPGYDSLQIFIEEAKKKNLSVHAWINPYRITKGSLKAPNTDISNLAENHPARIHPEWVVEYGGALYFNPGIKDVRDLIIKGALEIIKNYDVDGIHMDDYFYPYPVELNGEKLEFDDSAEYKDYSGELSLDDWRRSCVNALIQELYTSIKNVNQELKFGISPFGVWANNDMINGGSDTTAGTQGFYDLYADALAWIDGEYIDYIAPQIYWSLQDPNTPFDVLFDWWSKKIENKNIELVPGLAVYKSAGYQEPGWQETTQLGTQLQYIREKLSASGAAFYGYNELISESEAVKILFNEISLWK